MPQLRDIITPVHECLSPEHTLSDAIQFVQRTKWDTIPVTDEHQKLHGVLTRSSLNQAILDGQPLTSTIHSLIKKDVIWTHIDSSVGDIQEIIQKSEVGNIVILNDDHQVTGMLTKTDIIFTLFRATSSLKDQLEEILVRSELGAIITDDSERITFANQKICNMTGLTEAELLQREVTSLISGIQLESMEPSDHYRLQLGNSHAVTRISRFGKKGCILLFQDVSQVEKMAQELQSVVKWKSILQTVIDNAYEGLIMINEWKEVNFVSPSLLELFEFEESQILYKPIHDVLPQLGLDRVMKSGLPEYSEMMQVKGIRYTVHRVPIMQDNEIIGVIGKISFRGLHEMKEVVRRLEKSEKEEKQAPQAQHETSRFSFEQILTQDPQMEKIIRSAMKTAKGNSTVLIRGESGTGKELFAHAIHSMSWRSNGPFVTVNCAAIPEYLLESEFFGYEEGAFSGARQKGKKGKFDLANGGTLFLDEVGDMSLQLQAKMLRVLQEKEFYRVGGTERIQVDVRIIAATHRSLEEMVRNGDFRNDLFYRLNVISFEIPPLAKRKKDILLFIPFFMEELNRLNGTSIIGIDPLAEKAMIDYDWPGNVRELRNVMERAMLFSEHGKVELADLPEYMLGHGKNEMTAFSFDSESTLMEKAERAAVQQALEQSGGNKSKAAKLLGVSRSVLYDRLKKYQLSVQE
ncbi:sigma 54-interacting transcriptional regulator [Brevibacillus porteri]|uniref:sigma 54-interacting transcriptional regulator n=1 Tax=Brevibacillus porteri TaxID=2126350 RepID=UPI00370C9C4D